MRTLQRVREQQQAQPQKQQQPQPPQPRPATDGVASDRCGGRGCGAAEQAAASGDASPQPDPADVSALWELCGGAASPDYLAHILGRLCHGDVEVRLRFFAALQCAALHRDSITPCARMQPCRCCRVKDWVH